MAKLRNVNTTDVKGAIALGCRTMQSVFNADDNDVPFFGSSIVPHARSAQTWLKFCDFASESHVPGRHLNALLNAEAAAGVKLDESAVQKHARAAFLSFSGPVALPLNRQQIGGQPVNFVRHNCREGMHALYALVKYRNSEKAREIAEQMIDAVFEYWGPCRRWNTRSLERLGLNVDKEGTFITGEARMIGPLVKYYHATGYGPALELALMLKEKAIGGFFLQNGDYDRELFGTHTHSVTCVMSSLAQLADLTCDSTLMNRVRAFYDNGLWRMRDELGWVIETTADHAEDYPDRGEVNNTGDIVETALILGKWGYPQYFADAERIIRGHLLPSQLRDNSFIVEAPNPEGEDGKRNIAERHLGAFGFPAPYGHQPIGLERISFNMDIVGGAVGSLCEVLREATRFDKLCHRVNLLFDHETDAVKVESPYTDGALRITVKRPGPLFVRIPSWVDRDELTLNGIDCQRHSAYSYLFISKPVVGRPIIFRFKLPTQELVLKHRTHDIRVRLRGDEVMAMDNFGTDLTYFEAYES